MVDSSLDDIKASIRNHRNLTGSNGLSYATHLEIAVRLATGATSLNHFAAGHAQYRVGEFPAIEGILSAIKNCEHLINPTNFERSDFLEPEDYIRYEIWQTLAEIWCSVAIPQFDRYGEPGPLQKILAQAPEIETLTIPSMYEAGRILSRSESALRAPDEGWILSAWLFKRQGLGTEQWEQLRSAAEQHGYSKEASNYYRAACRESVNHTWHPASAISLGVYDTPGPDLVFFRDGESNEAFLERIEAIWRFEEPAAFE